MARRHAELGSALPIAGPVRGIGLALREDVDTDFDLDACPQTLRVAPTIPPEALPDLSDAIDDDEPTLVVVPSAIAALAQRSAMTTPSVHPGRSRAEEEDDMRRAVIGIWAIAAFLVLVLGTLVR